MEARHLLAAEFVINEIMYHAASGLRQDEWIEIYNAGDSVGSLAGYAITDGVEFDFPDIELDAGQYLVVAADTDAFRATYPDVANVVGGWTGQLSNRGERIELSDPSGNRVARAEYADSGDWSQRRLRPAPGGGLGWEWDSPHDGDGSTLELANPAVRADVGHNWSSSDALGGSPGAANASATDNIPPAIFDVHHTPIVPTSSDAVSVTAQVADETQTTVGVTLHYRQSTLNPPPFQQLPMFDDGTHGDGLANDGVFGVTLPAHEK